MSHVTQITIDNLYTDLKNFFLYPAQITGIYKEYKCSTNDHKQHSRRHGKNTWFNKDCEMMRKKCMLIKNSLRRHKSVSETQYQSFHEHVKEYKKLVSKTNKTYVQRF